MRKAVSVLLTLIMLSVAALMIIDSHTIVDTGTGNGAAIVWDNKFENFVSELSPNCSSDMEKITVYREWIIENISYDYECAENTVTDLTVEQIADIYTGTITNWSEVGGPDAEIVIIGREAASGTRDGFESITGTEDACQYDQELTSTGDVIQTVASNPDAIGYASLASVGDTVKTLSVDGVVPSEETIKDGSYQVQRDFVLATRKGEALSAAAQDFFDFATSDEAAQYIKSAGCVPVTE